MRKANFTPLAALALALAAVGCHELVDPPLDDHVHEPAPAAITVSKAAPAPRISVASMDAVSQHAVPGTPRADALLPVEARFLVLTGDSAEPGLDAIRSVLDHAGTPYDVFIAAEEPPLTPERLGSPTHGNYQATILTDSALAVGDRSGLEPAEWTVLAEYEARFRVRRATLETWPDPALGFGAWTAVDTTGMPLAVRCTATGVALFHDVNCDAMQDIEDAYVYVAAAGTRLTPLLTDANGNAVAAVHRGDDGRESLLLLFANNAELPHSLVFLHGVVDWLSGGAYLGGRRVFLSAQVDDLFLTSALWGGRTYRLDVDDMMAGVAWEQARRSAGSTPDFRIAHAFNGIGAHDGDPLTGIAKAQESEWHWINHTFSHRILDAVDYATATQELQRNYQSADEIGLTGHDAINIVTPGVSGLSNPAAMRAAVDSGVRFAVTDTSRVGCDNPTPNSAFYNAVASDILLIPRRPTNLFLNVSTPAEWVATYNDVNRAYWGRDSDYAQVIDQESDVLLVYLLRGDADPWMFHQANMRAYDGTHSVLGDLLDATIRKLDARVHVTVETPPMEGIGTYFLERVRYETAGVRATLLRGQALLIDVAREAPVPVSVAGAGLRVVTAIPGTTACIPLDAAGLGCTPAPARQGGPGPTSEPVTALCNSSSAMDPGNAGGSKDIDGGCAAAPPSGSLVLVLLTASWVIARRRYRLPGSARPFA